MNFLKLFNLIFLILVFTLEANAFASPTLQDSDLNGMISNKCSGAIVNIGRDDNDYAVILTNGHCVRSKPLPPEGHVKDEKYVRSDISVFNNENKSISLQPRNILYGSMENGDIGLIEISISYKQLKEMGVKIFELSKKDSSPGEELFTASGHWKSSQTCIFDHSVYQISEGSYKWMDAMAMGDSCKTKGGWSGSPLISKTNGQIVGVLNTSNENGQRCTLNNPCEKDEHGNVSVIKDSVYGIHTSVIWSCLSNGKVDLNKSGCKLSRLAKLKSPDDEHLTSKQKLEWLKKLAHEYPSKTIQIDLVSYDMFHMSTSAAEKIFVNEIILNSNSILELLFYTCHELGHHLGDKKIAMNGMAIEAESDFFAGRCLSNFTLKWEEELKPYLSLYKTINYDRCGNDIHCNKMVEIINQSFSSLMGVTIFPDNALNEKFPNGVDMAYPGPDCRALSAISGLLEVERPSCWFNPKKGNN